MEKYKNSVSLLYHLRAISDERDRRYQYMHESLQHQLTALFARSASHVTLEEYRQAHRDLESATDENTKRIEELEGQRRGRSDTWAWMIAAIGVISGAVIGIITLLVMHNGS